MRIQMRILLAKSGLAMLVAATILAMCAGRACATNGEVVTAPLRGVTAKSGLSLTIDSTWVSSVGYRPIRVLVSPLPAGAAVADRTLRIELSPGDVYHYAPELTVGQSLELPQGATSAAATIAVPQALPWRELRVDVYEDGERLADLSFSMSPMQNAVVRYNEDGAPSILLVDADAPSPAARAALPAGTNLLPDFRVLASLHPEGHRAAVATPAQAFGMAMGAGIPGQAIPLPTANAGPANATSPTPTAFAPIDDRSLVDLLPASQAVDLLPPTSLPERWIDYSGVDAIVVSYGELRDLRAADTPAWRAMRKWLAAGGMLCVFDVGGDRPTKLSQMLDLPDRWERPPQQPFDENYQFFKSDEQTYAYDEQGNAIVQKPPALRDVFGLRFVTCEAEYGVVAAIANPDPFPGTPGDWGQLFHAAGQSRWMWYQRHGISLTNENRDYWDFLIPGVGLPPVNAFRVLISLFAIVVGPVNYFVLKRKGRLNYLLLTVPLGAAAITIGLVAYALVSDGLGVRCRIRSFTELDQRNDRAASWSRQSYYASLAPSSGVVFPDDAAAYEILPEGEHSRQRAERRVEWSDDSQQLARGYLRPRTLAQFLVLRSTDEPKSELIVRSTNEKSLRDGSSSRTAQIENRLGSRIVKLWLIDERNKSFWAEDVAEGATRSLAPRSASDCRLAIADVIADNDPQLPEGFDPGMAQSQYGWGYNYRYYYGRTASGLPPATQTTSLLEKKLSQFSNPSFRLPPRSYVAIVEKSVETPTGVASAREEASFHVICGKW